MRRASRRHVCPLERSVETRVLQTFSASKQGLQVFQAECRLP
jgi:hypothetical protein